MSQKCLKMMITPNSFFLPFQYIPNSKTKLSGLETCLSLNYSVSYKYTIT